MSEVLHIPGLACVFVMDVVHPVIYKGIISIPRIAGIIILSILMCGFAVDLCVTVATILKFNKRLKLMNEMAAAIHKLSDEIGENIYENVTEVIEKSEEFQENHAELIDKISDTRESIRELPENAMNKLSETAENIREIPENAMNRLRRQRMRKSMRLRNLLQNTKNFSRRETLDSSVW